MDNFEAKQASVEKSQGVMEHVVHDQGWDLVLPLKSRFCKFGAGAYPDDLFLGVCNEWAR